MDLGLTLTMGWGRHWHMGSISDGVAQSAVATGGRCLGNVSFSRLLQTTCGDMNTAQVASWDTSVVLNNNDNMGARCFSPSTASTRSTVTKYVRDQLVTDVLSNMEVRIIYLFNF